MADDHERADRLRNIVHHRQHRGGSNSVERALQFGGGRLIAQLLTHPCARLPGPQR